MRFPGLRSVVPAVALLLSAGPGGCAAGPGRPPEAVTIRGVVRVVGNEPFTHVVVTVPDERTEAAARVDYRIVGPLAEELRARWQGKTVTLEGTFVPPGSPRFRHGFAPSRIVGPRGGH